MANLRKKAIDPGVKDRLSSSALTALVVAVIVAFNVVIYAVAQIFGLYFAVEERADLSLSGSTDALFAPALEEYEKSGKHVTLKFCMTEKELGIHTTGAAVYETAKYFEERYPGFIELEFIDLLTQRTDGGKGELVDLSKYAKDMRGEETLIRSYSIIFEYGKDTDAHENKNYRVVTDSYTNIGFADFYTLDSNKYITSYNGEEVMAGLISWVLADKDEHRSAYFTQGHSEIVDISFSNLLACAGYYIDVIDLQREDVPEDADILVISNPLTDFKKARHENGHFEIERIEDYMKRGGSLYVALDPHANRLPNLEGVLEEYGISLGTTTLKNGRVVRNMVSDSVDSLAGNNTAIISHYGKGTLAKEISKKVSKYSSGNVIIRDVSALELDTGKKAKPEALLVSSANAVLDASGTTVSKKGSYTIAAVSERAEENGKTSRLFVIPSIYLTVSDSLVSRGYTNKDFVFATMEHFFGADNMPYGCKDIVYNNQRLENLTSGMADLYTVLIMAIPVCVAICGAVILIIRKNR